MKEQEHHSMEADASEVSEAVAASPSGFTRRSFLMGLGATAAVVAETIAAGRTVALISDAGTPGISDPGFLLVRTCVEQGIEVETLPGATACIPALVQSGFPCDRFCFEGFLPQKKGRNKRLQELASEERTMVFYESPYRVVKCLEQFVETFGAE